MIFSKLYTHVWLSSLPETVMYLPSGVTTVTTGSCSISMMLCDPEDCADLFTRVESVPREFVLPLLQDLARRLSGRAKRQGRRTEHAVQRADEGQRPTTKAS